MSTVSTRISLVPGHKIESWNDSEVRAHFLTSYVEGTPPPTSLSLDGHNRATQRAGRRFMWFIFHEGTVEHPLKETLRVKIAEWRNCDY